MAPAGLVKLNGQEAESLDQGVPLGSTDKRVVALAPTCSCSFCIRSLLFSSSPFHVFCSRQEF